MCINVLLRFLKVGALGCALVLTTLNNCQAMDYSSDEEDGNNIYKVSNTAETRVANARQIIEKFKTDAKEEAEKLNDIVLQHDSVKEWPTVSEVSITYNLVYEAICDLASTLSRCKTRNQFMALEKQMNDKFFKKLVNRNNELYKKNSGYDTIYYFSDMINVLKKVMKLGEMAQDMVKAEFII